ncbi:MAG: T9SS type A sorting domain-containing protein [Bacteroidota bacterium]
MKNLPSYSYFRVAFLSLIFLSFQNLLLSQTVDIQRKRLNSSTNTAVSVPKDGWSGKTFIVDMDLDGINDRLIISTRDIGGGAYFVNMSDLTSYKFSLFGFGNGDDSKSPIISNYNSNVWSVINKSPGYDTLKTIYNTKLYDSIEYTYPLVKLGKNGKIIAPADLIIPEDLEKFNNLLKRSYHEIGITYINGDNYPDIIMASGNDNGINTVLVLVSTGSLKYKLGNLELPMPSPTSMSYGFGDMNGDLLPDVIVEGRGITDEWWKGVSNDSLYSYYECKDINGNYSKVKSIYTNPSYLHRFKSMYKFQVNDFDNDGFTDLLIYMNTYRKSINYPSTSNDSYEGYLQDVVPTVFFNNKRGGFQEAVDLLPSTAFINSGKKFTGRSVITYDYNNDGYDDIFMSMQEAAEDMNSKDLAATKHWGVQYFENNKNKGFVNKTELIFENAPIFIASRIKEITLNSLFDMDNDGKLELFINNPDFRDVVNSNLKITDKPLYYYKLNANNKFILDSAYKNSSITGIKLIDSLGQTTQCRYDGRAQNTQGILVDELPYEKNNGVSNFYLCNKDSITLNNRAVLEFGLAHQVHFFDITSLSGFTKSGNTFKVANQGNFNVNLIDEYFCLVSASNPGINIIKVNSENDVKKISPFHTVNGLITKNDTLLCTKTNIPQLDSIIFSTNISNADYLYQWSDNNFTLSINEKSKTPTLKVDGMNKNYTFSLNIFDKNKCSIKIPKITVTPQPLGSDKVYLKKNLNKYVCYPDSAFISVSPLSGASNLTYALFRNDTLVRNYSNIDSASLRLGGSYHFKVKYPNNCIISTDTILMIKTEKPSSPGVLDISYCQNSKVDTLKATSLTNHSLIWYGSSASGGTASNVAPVPNTNTTGTSNFYVSQKSNITFCESTRSKLIVYVNILPVSPIITRDTENNLVSNSLGMAWFKDGVKMSDTAQKIKPTSNGIYTATTTQNGCTSSISQGYYYLTNAVSNLSTDEYFKISPNPTSGELNINYRFSSSKDVYISVIDMNGRNLILNRKINSGSKVNLGNVSKGNYIIQIKDKTGRLITSQKVVKE